MSGTAFSFPYFLFSGKRLRIKLFLILLISTSVVFSQKSNPTFKSGEFFKYRVSYGLLNAGFASLKLEDTLVDGKEVFHAKGRGWSTGMVDLFFHVEDDYQSYFDKKTSKPLHFIRHIKEGGYTKNKEIFFDFEKGIARVVDHKKNTEKNYPVENEAFDMISAWYYFRTIDFSSLKKGDVITVKMFYDNRMNSIYLRYMGKEVIKTKFGKLRTIVIIPSVDKGRIFSDKESVKAWFTDDNSRIMVKAKASILVGSIKMELHETGNLTTELPLAF